MADNGSTSQELLCIQEEGPEDFFLVPFPIFGSKTVVVRWKKELQDHLTENTHFILKHPDSDVGIECLRGGFYSDFDTTLLYINADPFYRVGILSSRVDDAGMTFAKCELFREEKVSRETFQGSAFKGKITRLTELAVQFQTMLTASDEDVVIGILNLNTIEENEAGLIIDFYTNWLNEIIYEEGIEGDLISILEERNVEERMDKAIALYEWCFDEERTWIQELRLQNQDGENALILPGGAMAKEQPTSAENIPTVSQLLRKLIFETGPEEQSPDASLSGDEDELSGSDDPNGRENLIRSRIYRKKMPIPLRNLDEIKVAGLLDFERYMGGEIIGQHRAISSLVRAFNIGGAGFLPDNSTIANLMFSGPTGVGKTETARALARFLKRSELANGIDYPDLPLVKIDSGTVSRFGTSTLIGSSIGVVGSRGHKEGATEPLLACNRFPENRIMVVLWDEIEKALLSEYYGGADELLSVLLPVLDDGEFLTKWDLNSRTPTNFRKSIHIFTSNIGAKKIEEEGGKKIGFDVRGGKSGNHLTEEEVAELNERIYQLVREEYNYFPPEFRSRITRHVVYRFHSRADHVEILEKEIRQFKGLFEKADGINVELSDDTKAWLVDFGVVREAGARSLQRVFYRKVVYPIATYVNAEEIGSGDDIMVDVDNPESEDTNFLFFKHD